MPIFDIYCSFDNYTFCTSKNEQEKNGVMSQLQKKLFFFKMQIKFVTFKMDAPEYEYAHMFGFKFCNICSES